MLPEQQILQEIADKLAHHHVWSLVNFWGLQTLLWVSIIASVSAALLTATIAAQPSNRRRLAIASLAAVPAAVVTIVSTFSLVERYQYHDDYIRVLEQLRRQMIVQKNIDAAGAAQRLTEFENSGPRVPPPKITELKKDKDQ
jgi:signal transduction histidine kinase